MFLFSSLFSQSQKIIKYGVVLIGILSTSLSINPVLAGDDDDIFDCPSAGWPLSLRQASDDLNKAIAELPRIKVRSKGVMITVENRIHQAPEELSKNVLSTIRGGVCPSLGFISLRAFLNNFEVCLLTPRAVSLGEGSIDDLLEKMTSCKIHHEQPAGGYSTMDFRAFGGVYHDSEDASLSFSVLLMSTVIEDPVLREKRDILICEARKHKESLRAKRASQMSTAEHVQSLRMIQLWQADINLLRQIDALKGALKKSGAKKEKPKEERKESKKA